MQLVLWPMVPVMPILRISRVSEAAVQPLLVPYRTSFVFHHAADGVACFCSSLRKSRCGNRFAHSLRPALLVQSKAHVLLAQFCTSNGFAPLYALPLDGRKARGQIDRQLDGSTVD